MAPRTLLLAALCLLLCALPQAVASVPGSYERVDEDMDIMALIGEEDGAAACASPAGCGGGAPAAAKEGISALQVDAQYKLKQPVKAKARVIKSSKALQN
mmetsp:Transcript_94402/g.293606  ORF Transcript_94402/g.293606 Transcript_94402/m.293606 type:complete len:100 (+) Transcript_94402:150-449(+)